MISGDGCSGDLCEVELGYTCTGATFSLTSPGDTCSEICGDGLVVGREQCDDGNLQSGDGCNNQCQLETGWVWDNGTVLEKCGDGIRIGSV